MMLEITSWIAAGERILAGTSLILVIAWALRALARTALMQRAVWQATLVVTTFFLISELAGSNFTALFKNTTAVVNDYLREVRIELKEPSHPQSTGETLHDRSDINTVISPAAELLWPGIAWAIGSLLLLTARFLQTGVCLLVRKQSQQLGTGPLLTTIEETAEMLEIKTKLKVYKSIRYRTPVAFGFWSPALGLPDRFEEDFSPEAQKTIFAHELAHVANNDPFWRGVADYLCMLCWWNPLVWYLRVKFLEACEFAADEESARVSNGELLAQALVAVANRLCPDIRGNGLGMAGAYRSNLGLRVRRLLKNKELAHRTGRGWRRMLQFGITAFLVCGVMIGLNILEARVNGLTLTRGTSPLRLALTTVLSPSLPSSLKSGASEPPVQPTATEPAPVSQALTQSNPQDGQVTPAVPRPATSEIIVEATRKENSPAPSKILIEANWIEASIPVDLFRELGLDNVAAETDKSTEAEAKLIRREPGAGWQTNAFPGGQLAGPFRAVLTPELYEQALSLLKQRAGIDLLSSPRLTLLPEREGLISILDTQTIVTGIATNATTGKERKSYLETEAMEFGPTLRVITRLNEDGSIGLRTEGTVRAFMGYEDTGKTHKVEVWSEGKKVRTPLPLPRISERRYATDVALHSGETVLLCGLSTPEKRRTKEKVVVLGDIPLLGRLFRSESEETYSRQLILLVHVEIVP